MKLALLVLATAYILSTVRRFELMGTLCLICCMVSMRKMEEVGSEADIFDCGPWRAGKKEE